MSEYRELGDEAKAWMRAIADCLRASGHGRCYPNGHPDLDEGLVLDPEENCIGPKPGCPCDRKREGEG